MTIAVDMGRKATKQTNWIVRFTRIKKGGGVLLIRIFSMAKAEETDVRFSITSSVIAFHYLIIIIIANNKRHLLLRMYHTYGF